MGCDIHLFIEYKNHAGNWVCFGQEINPGRSYWMFNRMAGIRGYSETALFKPKGLPENCSGESDSAAHLFICELECECGESRYISKESAESQIQKGYAKKHPTKDFYITNSDLHSHSWLTPDEFGKCLQGMPREDRKWLIKYFAVFEAMNVFKKEGYETRIVFWFDN